MPPKRVVPINIPNPFDKYVDDPVERVDTTYTPGYWRSAPAPFVNISINPQNSRKLLSGEVDSLKNDLNQTLAIKDCKEFVKRLLEQLKTDTGESQHGTTDILGLFEAVKRGLGFDYRPMKFEATAWGGPGKTSFSINPTDLWRAKGPIGRGGTLIHELIHIAGYNHDTIARTMFGMGERWSDKGNPGWKAWRGTFPDPVRDPLFSDKDRLERLDGAYSGFMKNVIDQHCK